MPKPTTQNKIDALTITSAMIERYLVSSSMYESDGTIAEIKRIQKQLETRKQRLLQPKPKRTRQPKVIHVGSDTTTVTVRLKPNSSTPTTDDFTVTREPYTNSMPRTGRRK